tara:strand:- start:1756 stop:2430 length:675 start_codon:yes stop_codon:yes gene_type:complete
MAKKLKITRKELLKEPDQFLSSTDKAISFFKQNRSTVIGSILGVLIIGMSIFGYQRYQISRMMKYEALYFKMEEIIKVSTKKTDSLYSELIKIRDKIGEGPHRNRASLLIADFYFQNEDYEKAKFTYEEIINNSSGLNYEMARISLAYVYEATEDYKKAIDLLKLAIDSKNNFPLFQVYWSLARCHENNKDTSNALLILREMQIKFSSAAGLEKIDKKIQQLST